MEFEIGVCVLSPKLQRVFFLLMEASQGKKKSLTQVRVSSDCFSIFNAFILTKYIKRLEDTACIYSWKMRPTVGRAQIFKHN